MVNFDRDATVCSMYNKGLRALAALPVNLRTM